ncbi:MAG: hypothetical protein EAZ53_02205 [Bacteroidetes bacterium]|nr:MAG: hypothetical protein EAZ53_02205 [Bacteroidota bacterium]
MYHQTVIPIQSNFVVHFPAEFVGKEVEIVFGLKENVIEVENQNVKNALDRIKNGRKIDLTDFKFDREEANER